MNEHQMALYTQRQIAGLEAERDAHLTQIVALVEERDALRAQIAASLEECVALRTQIAALRVKHGNRT